MITIRQIQKQFLLACISYVGPESGGETIEPKEQVSPGETHTSPEALAKQTNELKSRFKTGERNYAQMAENIEKNGVNTGNSETTQEMRERRKGEQQAEEVSESFSQLQEDMPDELMKKLSEKYDPEKLDAISEIYKKLIDEGADIPENIEDFETMIGDEIARRELAELEGENPNDDVDNKVIRQAANSILSSSSASHMRGYTEGFFGRGGQPMLRPGNAEANRGQLDAAISEAPNEQAKQLLRRAGDFLGKNETTHRSELQQFLGFDPKQTPWCKGFTNECAKEAGISLNSAGSLFSLSGVNDGRKLSPNEEPLPGDIVMVRRNEGGHIGFFLGMSPSGNPIIIGGNQGGERVGGGEVSIKEERRELIGINRIA